VCVCVSVRACVQIHNLGWLVQEAQTARVAVSMLDESQDWFQETRVLLARNTRIC
jgi:hypothetical protein